VAIQTLAGYKTFAGITSTDATRDASLSAILTEVNAAISRLCRPWLFERVTMTDVILDAPLDAELVLPVIPVPSITSLYLNWSANGDPAAFTSNDLLTPYSGYLLDVNDKVNDWSTTGIVYCRGGQNSNSWGQGSLNWGGERHWPPTRLASTLTPGRGAIKVTFPAGCLTVPPEVTLCANLATSMIYARRTYGMPVNSESWNGDSYSMSGAYTAAAALSSPDCAELLAGYQSAFVAAP
jgi:hypothetical protein